MAAPTGCHAAHRDRPDAFIQAGNTKVGVEITEAIPKQFASLCAFAEREFPNHWLPVAHFPWNAPQLTSDQMRELLGQQAIAFSDWMGDQPEREWPESHFIIALNPSDATIRQYHYGDDPVPMVPWLPGVFEHMRALVQIG